MRQIEKHFEEHEQRPWIPSSRWRISYAGAARTWGSLRELKDWKLRKTPDLKAPAAARTMGLLPKSRRMASRFRHPA